MRSYKAKIDKVNNLDFSNVEFISRSAAHELLKIREEYKVNENKYLNIKNANENVFKMLEIVAKSMVVKKEVPKLNLVKRRIFA